jgi:hypothetical protein
MLCRWDWTQWRLLSWRRSCREGCASTLRVDCIRKLTAFSLCWRSLCECSRSLLVLVGLLGLLVRQCRPVFTCTPYELYYWIYWRSCATDADVIDKVQAPIMEDHCLTVQEIADEVRDQ